MTRTVSWGIIFWWSQVRAGVKVVAPRTELSAGMPAPAGYLASRGVSAAPPIDYSASPAASHIASPPAELDTGNPYAVLFRWLLETGIPIWRDLSATADLPNHFPMSLSAIPGK